MKLPEADWQVREGMTKLLAALGAGKGETRFVGGSVRDTLLGLPVSDVDLATRIAPEAVIKRLNKAGIKAVPTGIAHGTVTAVLRDGPVEVTTLRRDVATDGRRATIAFTSDWQEDAARRDFTINALSADPASGELFDYFGGLHDLPARRVRFIGDPLTRIAEDHLRILRFFRFHARFGEGPPDAAALAACASRANDLMALSRERIADELLKLLALPFPATTVQLMITHGILAPVLPEITDARLLADLIAGEREASISGDPIRRFAALLPPQEAIASAVAARLRLSKKSARRLVSAAGRDSGGIENAELLAYRIGVDEAVDRLLLNGEDNAKIATLSHWRAPHFALGGGALIAMGLPAGPAVAKTLQAIEREWAQAGFSSDEAEFHALARRHVDQALRDSQ